MTINDIPKTELTLLKTLYPQMINLKKSNPQRINFQGYQWLYPISGISVLEFIELVQSTSKQLMDLYGIPIEAITISDWGFALTFSITETTEEWDQRLLEMYLCQKAAKEKCEANQKIAKEEKARKQLKATKRKLAKLEKLTAKAE